MYVFDLKCPRCEEAGFAIPFIFEFTIEPYCPPNSCGPADNWFPAEGGYAEHNNGDYVNGRWVCPKCSGRAPGEEEAYTAWKNYQRDCY